MRRGRKEKGKEAKGERVGRRRRKRVRSIMDDERKRGDGERLICRWR